jgi:hypothetical protein
MRTALCLAFTAATSAACLPDTEFICILDDECQGGARPGGRCEPSFNHCSFPDSSCIPSGRRFDDAAGLLADRCVGEPVRFRGGVDASLETMPVGCSAGYASVAGPAHFGKTLTNLSWDKAKNTCKLTSAIHRIREPSQR